jgi:Cyclophilin-like family
MGVAVLERPEFSVADYPSGQRTPTLPRPVRYGGTFAVDGRRVRRMNAEGRSLGSSGCPATGYTAAPTGAVSPSSSLAAAVGVPVGLRFGDHQTATAILVDTRAAREFAAMLPLTVELTDRMGQAKSGRLPHSLDLTGDQST